MPNKTVLLITAVTLVILTTGCTAPLMLGAAAAAAAGGVVVADNNRTAGTMVDDKTIELTIANTLAADRALSESSHINVTSYNAVVLLTGEVTDSSAQPLAGKVAADHPQVKAVINELAVAEPSSFTSRTQDTWITTKVKSQLLASKEVRGNQVKVITEKGIVYLMGLVKRDEGAEAANIATKVDGALRVVKVFEYLN